MNIRVLGTDDAEAAVSLRRLALTTDSYAFAERLESDPALKVDFVRQRLADSGIESGAVVVGAFDPELIGVVGLHRSSTDAARVRLWGFYVQPDRRRSGVGSAVLNYGIRCAKRMAGVLRIELSVSDAAVAAIRLYESAGFETQESTAGKRQMTLDID